MYMHEMLYIRIIASAYGQHYHLIIDCECHYTCITLLNSRMVDRKTGNYYIYSFLFLFCFCHFVFVFVFQFMRLFTKITDHKVIIKNHKRSRVITITTSADEQTCKSQKSHIQSKQNTKKKSKQKANQTNGNKNKNKVQDTD